MFLERIQKLKRQTTVNDVIALGLLLSVLVLNAIVIAFAFVEPNQDINLIYSFCLILSTLAGLIESVQFIPKRLHSVNWSKDTLYVFINVSDSRYAEAVVKAMHKWNKIPFVNLKLAKSINQANIRIYTNYNCHAQYTGCTYSNCKFSFPIELNRFYLDKYSDKELLNTACHEIGHALGLAHSDSKLSVMYPTIQACGISMFDAIGVMLICLPRVFSHAEQQFNRATPLN